MLYIIGMGPGDPCYLTELAKHHLKTLDVIIGVNRQLETVKPYQHEHMIAYAYSGKLDHLKEHIENAKAQHNAIGILASGDPSFYGISQWIMKMFPEDVCHIIPGISSTQILFAKAKIPMHDFYMTSLHGRKEALDALLKHPRLCLLTDRQHTPYVIAKHYLSHKENPRIIIGENLSYPDECITDCLASAVDNRDYKMSVVIIINERS